MNTLSKPIVSLTEATEVKVLQSENIVHILIAYPRVKPICKKITIFTVAHQLVTLQLRDDTIAECDDDILAVNEYVPTTYAAVYILAEQDTCPGALHADRRAT